MNRFAIVKEQAAVFCFNRNSKESAGLKRVIGYVRNDIKEITGILPELYEMTTDHLPSDLTYSGRNMIVAGTVGENPYIDRKIKENKVNVREIVGKRESYRMLVITDQEEARGNNILIIAGSDKLGTIYGLLHLSEVMGVTPWGYWADVKPATSDVIEINYDKLSCVSKEPTIRLRGFFLNDEWPSLRNFVMQAFGGFNEYFYEKVFELLLRLKGNFLWPAMLSASFSLDGRKDPLANASLANELGIIMGTSHHEPIMRAGEEFSHFKSSHNAVRYGKDWNYDTNTKGLDKFWEDSALRNKPFRNLITVGMRGERDSMLLDTNSLLKDNIELLQKVIRAQKKILKECGMEQRPKVLALYKEVEDYFYGDETSEGLKDWEELEDVMLLLSDDNFGNIRTLPSKEQWNRHAGWGMYYHLDYHGGPISYEWVNSTPITKIWEQMCMAYEYGIRDLWIVNVGDLRPQELPLSYFMNLAYDFETYGSKAINKTAAFTKLWVKEIFGPWLEEKQLKYVVEILNEYTKMNGDRRPEAVYPETFSILNEKEALRELNRAKHIEQLVADIEEKVPSDMIDCFYGLLSFPALASANVRKMSIYAALNQFFYQNHCSMANTFDQFTKECIQKDQELVEDYNEKIADGKWKGMMSSNHIGFRRWNDEGWSYPKTMFLPEEEVRNPLLFVEGSEVAYTMGATKTLLFTSTEQETYDLLVCHETEDEVAFSNEPWIVIEQEKIHQNALRLRVSVDWSECDRKTVSSLQVMVGQTCFVVPVQIDLFEVPEGLCENCFVESKHVISMEAIHYTKKSSKGGKLVDERLECLAWNRIQKFLKPVEEVDSGYCYPEWKKIEGYGRSLGAMKVFPTTYSNESPKDAPYLLYQFFLQHEGTYRLNLQLAPSNNVEKGKGMRIAYSLDESDFITVDTLPKNYMAGENTDSFWCKAVLNQAREYSKKIVLTQGVHTLKIAAVDAGIVLQKIELYQNSSNTYYGYQETYHIKSK